MAEAPVHDCGPPLPNPLLQRRRGRSPLRALCRPNSMVVRPLPSPLSSLRKQCFLLSAFCFLLCLSASPAETVLAHFQLRDFLNRDWQKELVTFDVDRSLLGRADVVLLDGNGQPVPFQWSTGGTAGIAFLASVPRLTRAD